MRDRAKALSSRLIGGRWALAAMLPFICVAVIAAVASGHGTLKAVSTPLLGVAVTLAIFAINLPLITFQLGPYRSAAGVPRLLYGGALFTMLLSIVPLAFLADSQVSAARVSVAAIPVLALCALGLARLAEREGSAEAIVRKLVRPEMLEDFASRFAAAVRAQAERHARLDPDLHDTPVRVSAPMHELMHRPLPPAVDGDPLQGLRQVGRIAATREDLSTFAHVINAFIAVAERLIEATSEDEDYHVRQAAKDLVNDRFYGLAAGLDRDPSTQALAEGFVETCADYVRDSFHRGRANDDLTHAVAGQGVAVLHRLMKEDRRGPSFISMLTALRQVTELALRQRPEMMDEYPLAGHARRVIGLANSAIEQGDVDALYRCSETIGWIGCSAVRNDCDEVGRRCAEAIVQLGRVARVRGLDCFWERCSRTPFDHAEEHLEWMITWIPQSTASDKSGWLEMLGRAAARMRGVEIELTLDDNGKDVKMTVDQTKPHRESIDDHGVLRTYDYSDPEMVDEYLLR